MVPISKIKVVWSTHTILNLLDNRSRLSRRTLTGIQIFQDDDKLIATESRDSVPIAHARTQPYRHFDQQGVAYVVSHRVIERFEPIEINQNDGAKPIAPLATGQRLIEAVKHETAVG
jgi:hypothetical protein